MADFYTLITNIGLAKLANAEITGDKVLITEIAVGDGLNGEYYNPVQTQTALENEVWRDSVSNKFIDPDNSNKVIFEAQIPITEGGWYIREIGAFDADGDLIAISKVAESYKPTNQQGGADEYLIRVPLLYSNTSVVDILIDPAVVLATRQYVDSVMIKGTVRPEGNITANPGILYRYETTGDIYRKESGTGNTGWRQLNFDLVHITDFGTGTISLATIQAALTAIGSTECTLHGKTGIWNITDDLTIPDNVTLSVSRGTIFNISAGKTLTINGGLTGRLKKKIFSGDGLVVFGQGSIDYAIPQWWGAKANDTTDDKVSIQKFIDQTTAPEYRFTGNYGVGSAVSLKDSCTYNAKRATLKALNSNAIFTWDGNLSYCKFKGFHFDSVVDPETGSSGTAFYSTTGIIDHTTFRDITFSKSLTDCFYCGAIYNDFYDCMFGSGGTVGTQHRHLYFIATGSYLVNENNFYGCKFTASNSKAIIQEGNVLGFTGCGWEDNNCSDQTISFAGVKSVKINSCWVESNNGRAFAEVLNGNVAGQGCRVSIDSSKFVMDGVTNTEIFFSGTGSTAFGVDLRNCYGRLDGVIISQIGAGADSGIGYYEGTNFVGYSRSDQNNYPRQQVSTQGLLSRMISGATPFLLGWTTGATQGWAKTGGGAPTWTAGSVAGWAGATINFISYDSGENLFYQQIPVERFKGKRLLVRGVYARLTGTLAAVAMGYNFTQATPTTLTQDSTTNVTSTTLTEKYMIIDVPSDAAYLNLGIRANIGNGGTGQIKAFDFWEISTKDNYIEPLF